MSNSFKDIKAWQFAHQFVIDVYKHTREFPETERFGLCSQFQRAAVSIAANIAEGYKKLSKPDKLRFFNISQGSLEECRYYILLSKDLGYINNDSFENLDAEIEKVSKYINAYCKGIINNNAYVTKNELYQLIIQLLKDTLTTCEIRETIEPGIYEFVLPKSDPRVLKRFLDNNVPIDIDSQRLYNSFIGKIEDHLSLEMLNGIMM